MPYKAHKSLLEIRLYFEHTERIHTISDNCTASLDVVRQLYE